MESPFRGPVNIGSEEMVTINQMAETIMKISGKKLGIRHIAGPTGVRGRNSDNKLLQEKLGWAPSQSLYAGLSKTYPWIAGQLHASLQEKVKSAVASEALLPLGANVWARSSAS
jgi:nucleoside-diphosphate-sugar epimerase